MTTQKFPTEPGYWWRQFKDGQAIVEVYTSRNDGKLYWNKIGSLVGHRIKAGRHWLCPCLTPDEMGRRLAELQGAQKPKFGHFVENGAWARFKAYADAATALGITLPEGVQL